MPVNTFFGCPGGELTFPARLVVRNGCDFEGVDCAASTGPGAACDSSPASVMCSTCAGDYDGCKAGHLLPIGARGALICTADSPSSAAEPAPTALWVALASATFYFEGAAPVTVSADPTPFDLVAVLATGSSPIPAFTVPSPATGHEGAPVVAIRMTLWSAGSAMVPDGQGGSWPVVPRSGAEDSGLDLDLEFPAGGTSLAPGASIHAVAQASSSPYGWQAMFPCSNGERTVLRSLRVLNLCDTPGACVP